MIDPPTPTLLSYNTVERLLRGDFYHSVSWSAVREDMRPWPSDWPLAGIGTTNWFRRNGETIVGGTVGRPSLLWADPEGPRPMHVLDLLREQPSPDGPGLVTPAAHEDPATASFPFLACGVCNPSREQRWTTGPRDDLHAWLRGLLQEANVGLAAVEVRADVRTSRYAAAFYLPLEGLELRDGYNAADNLKLASGEQGVWEVRGIYAANPTLQRVISVEGLPLHLHGWDVHSGLGGHVIRLECNEAEARIWPLSDFTLKIRNLEKVWLPVRNLALTPS